MGFSSGKKRFGNFPVSLGVGVVLLGQLRTKHFTISGIHMRTSFSLILNSWFLSRVVFIAIILVVHIKDIYLTQSGQLDQIKIMLESNTELLNGIKLSSVLQIVRICLLKATTSCKREVKRREQTKGNNSLPSGNQISGSTATRGIVGMSMPVVRCPLSPLLLLHLLLLDLVEPEHGQV